VLSEAFTRNFGLDSAALFDSRRWYRSPRTRGDPAIGADRSAHANLHNTRAVQCPTRRGTPWYTRDTIEAPGPAPEPTVETGLGSTPDNPRALTAGAPTSPRTTAD
jgi:hypothetical protein